MKIQETKTRNEFLLNLKKYVLKNKIPVWEFKTHNAYIVASFGVLYNNIYDLLTSFVFAEDLCLYNFIDEQDYEFQDEYNVLNLKNSDLKSFKFFNSNLNKKNYFLQCINVQCLSYHKFVESAFFHFLEFSLKKNKSPYSDYSDNLVSFIEIFSGVLVVNNNISSLLYNHLIKLKIFSFFPKKCLDGFFTFYTNQYIITFLTSRSNDPNEMVIMERNSRKFRVMNAFSFYFSPKFRASCFKDCIKTKDPYVCSFAGLSNKTRASRYKFK